MLTSAVRRTARWLYYRMRSLRACIRYAIVGRSRPFLLVDTPEHANLGDHAIALAEIRLIERLFGADSYFEITSCEYDGCKRLLSLLSPGRQTVLVQGGGFLGSLWPEEELRFQDILRSFRDHRVVVFPQTVSFDVSAAGALEFFDRSRAAYSSHPRLTVCCRERRTLEFLNASLPTVRTLLVPDIVLSLPDRPRAGRRDGVLICLRSDRERIFELSEDLFRSAIHEVYPNVAVHSVDTVVDHKVSPKNRAREVRGKLRQFAEARLVITDRLHGMVFCAITGTPCIVLDNVNGKVRGVYEWLADVPYIRFARDAEDALRQVRAPFPDPGEFPAEFSRLYSSLVELLRSSCDE